MRIWRGAGEDERERVSGIVGFLCVIKYCGSLSHMLSAVLIEKSSSVG